jgi:hypothetical protein
VHDIVEQAERERRDGHEDHRLVPVAIAPLCSAGWTARTKARKGATRP